MCIRDRQCSSCLIKIILIGDASVGKTNLIRRQVDNHFEPDFEPTIGKIKKNIYIYMLVDFKQNTNQHSNNI